MKKIIVSLSIAIVIISCTKSKIDVKNEDIPTISLTDNNINEDERLVCGTCVNIKYGYPLQVPDGPFHCLNYYGICSMSINYRTSPNEGSFNASFENIKGKLQMKVQKISISDEKRNIYFKNNQFFVEKPEYMNNEILSKLNLPIPYLIKNGGYPIIEETNDFFTIQF